MFSVVRSRCRNAALLCVFACSPGLAADTLPITDPTRPPYRSVALPGAALGEALLLRSTHVSPTKRTAVINSRIVAVGSRIAGAVVTDIEQGRVTLRRDSDVIVLQLIATPVSRPAEDSR